MPRILKVASLQLTGIFLLRDSSNFDLFKISDDPLVQAESSSNILFSIPKWYPDITALNGGYIVDA